MSSHTGQSKSQNDLLDKKPEAGLAEWTSKIKAMQRQVDADEEAEQRTLEEEIAASRLARLRRSHGVGYSSRTNSLDVCKCRFLSPFRMGNDSLRGLSKSLDIKLNSRTMTEGVPKANSTRQQSIPRNQQWSDNPTKPKHCRSLRGISHCLPLVVLPY